MANGINTLNAHAGYARDDSVLARLRTAFAEYRTYRALRSELSALSDRELADIGVARAKIDEIARDGARRI